MEYIYAALLLHKTKQEINEHNLHKVVSATGSSVDDNRVKVLVASLKGVNIDEQLAHASMAAAPVASEAKAEKKEEKKEEPKAQAAEGLASLFG